MIAEMVALAAKPPESCYLWSRDRLKELAIEMEEEGAVEVDRERVGPGHG